MEAEILERQLKYRPDFPDRFASHDHGLDFCRGFFRWHNEEHCHWGIGLLTPARPRQPSRHGPPSCWPPLMPATRSDSSEAFRGRLRRQRRSGSTHPKIGQQSAHLNYPATLNSFRSCLKVIDTFCCSSNGGSSVAPAVHGGSGGQPHFRERKNNDSDERANNYQPGVEHLHQQRPVPLDAASLHRLRVTPD